MPSSHGEVKENEPERERKREKERDFQKEKKRGLLWPESKEREKLMEINFGWTYGVREKVIKGYNMNRWLFQEMAVKGEERQNRG